MIDLDELEDIAILSSFGRAGIFSGPRASPKNMATPVCRNGHVRTEANTRWSKSKTGRRHRTCIECARIASGFMGAYKPRKRRNAT
jgi:hypothetical protein